MGLDMANRFHKLKNNQSDFPIVENVDVYKFDNDFDYRRYDYTQMELQICSVPWDVGEAHVGQRTISGIGNVVYFGSKQKRDEWFANIPDTDCYRFTTKFKELHREQVIDVPIPYDMCAKHNYLVVRYNLFANDDSPVAYEGEDGKQDWFWFIREVEFKAPNTTRLHLLDDAFQTWIYDVNVTSMILERGHAPMFSTRTEQYLENPIDNNAYLLTEDVNFGNAETVRYTDAVVLNSNNVYACIACTGSPISTWGTKEDDTWRTPANTQYQSDGVPSVFVFALPASDLTAFLQRVHASIPQFKQTVQGVFFASRDLITLGSSFEFAKTTCYRVSSGRRDMDFTDITKDMFGYEERYADIAKLYTSPYAHIEVTDENGNVDVIKIEDSTGKLSVSVALSIAYPFVNIDAHIIGAGGSTRSSVVFRNVDSKTFSFGGTWYETLHSWKVPTFAIVIDAATEYDYSTHFDRKQAKLAYENTYASALASASTSRTNARAAASTERSNARAVANVQKTNTINLARTAKSNASNEASTARTNSLNIARTSKTNADNYARTGKQVADASATTAKDNAYRTAYNNRTNAHNIADANSQNTYASANTARGNEVRSANAIIENSLLQRTANSSITSRSNESAISDSNLANSLATALQAWEAGYTYDTVNNENDAAYTSAAIGAAGGIASSVISGAVSGGAIGAGLGLVTGAISGATSLANTAVAANLRTSQANATVRLSEAKLHETSRSNLDRTNNQNSANTDNVHSTNLAIQGTSANSAATQKSNAADTQTTAKANADRTRFATKEAANLTMDGDCTNAVNTMTTAKENAALVKETENTNAANSYNAAVDNANNSYSTVITNADNIYNTAVGNANSLYDTLISNIQAIYDMQIDNIKRTYETQVSNAQRTRDTAQNAITNATKQAALRQPYIFGNFADGDSATTKPIALFSNIVTQSKSAIESAGDEMLRYGYYLNRQWEFDGDWNVGRYFTYWKLNDFWVSNLNVPDLYMDKLRFFLFGGVTVWSEPEYIGNKSIYDNFQ